jgi:carboxyl-terminal processing protease
MKMLSLFSRTVLRGNLGVLAIALSLPACAPKSNIATRDSQNGTSSSIETRNEHNTDARSEGASVPTTTSATTTTGTSTTGATEAAQPSATASASPAIRPIETFDAVWITVRDSHFDKSLNGIDWNAVREELRPRAIQAASQDELRAVLSDMLARLGQSHFSILPSDEAHASPTVETPEETIVIKEASMERAETAQLAGTSGEASSSSGQISPSVDTTTSTNEPGVSGIDITLVEGTPTVLRVQSDVVTDVAPGWVLISVDDQPVDRALEPMRTALERERARDAANDSPHARQLRAELSMTAGALLTGRAGTTARAVFRNAEGVEVDREIAFRPAPFGSTRFGNLPPIPVCVDSRLLDCPTTDGTPVRIGVIDFNIWLTAASPAIDRAVDTMRGCDGIVLDLRGNPGGVGAMSMGIAGHFLKTRASLGSMIGRDTTLEFNASPRKVSTEGKRVRPFSKPLAILVDERTASTSEVFAAGLQDLGRARVFGTTSAGMALPAQAIELPNGDVLLHAVADFVTPNGQRIEGRGVIPNEITAETRADLLAGRDAALRAATAWITQSALATRHGGTSVTNPTETAVVPTTDTATGAETSNK